MVMTHTDKLPFSELSGLDLISVSKGAKPLKKIEKNRKKLKVLRRQINAQLFNRTDNIF